MTGTHLISQQMRSDPPSYMAGAHACETILTLQHTLAAETNTPKEDKKPVLFCSNKKQSMLAFRVVRLNLLPGLIFPSGSSPMFVRNVGHFSY